MDQQPVASLVLIPWEELNLLKEIQQEILTELRELRKGGKTIQHGIGNHLTAIEFMKEVKICRSKFDKLVLARKIKIVKKKRKIYVPIQEVEKYFNDPTIQ